MLRPAGGRTGRRRSRSGRRRRHHCRVRGGAAAAPRSTQVTGSAPWFTGHSMSSSTATSTPYRSWTTRWKNSRTASSTRSHALRHGHHGDRIDQQRVDHRNTSWQGRHRSAVRRPPARRSPHPGTRPAPPDKTAIRYAESRPFVAEKLICQALHPYPDDLVIANKGGICPSEAGRMASRRSARLSAPAVRTQSAPPRLERIELFQLHASTPGCPSTSRWVSSSCCKTRGRWATSACPRWMSNS